MKTLVALVGTKFRGPAMMKLLASLPQGEPLVLIRDRDNRFDPFAVQVWARGEHIGFIKGTQVKPVALAMDREIGPAAEQRPAKLAIDGGKQPMVEIDE